MFAANTRIEGFDPELAAVALTRLEHDPCVTA